MKKHLWILFLLMSMSFVAYAQGIRKPQSDSLIKIIPLALGYGVYSEYNVPYGYTESNLYTIGGKLVTEQDVAFHLLNYAPSAIEYNAAKKNMRTWYILYGGAAAATLGSVLTFAGGTKSIPSSYTANGVTVYGSTYQHNYTGAGILTGIALGLATAGIITILKAPKHLKKSVWLYNSRFE